MKKYRVLTIERIDNTVFRDDDWFDDRQKAEEYFTEKSEKPTTIDVTLFYKIPSGGERELTRFVRSVDTGKDTLVRVID